MQKKEQIPCPLCHATNYSILFHDHNRRDNIKCFGTYVQCQTCSLVYLLDPPEWEETLSFYSSPDKNHSTNTGHANKLEIQNQLKKPVPIWKELLRKVRFRPHSWPLEPVPQGSKRLLDLGCGNGVKLIEFDEKGYEVWGVDVGCDAIHICKSILPGGHFIRGQLHETGLPDDYFDYIRIDNALEHLPNPKEILRECYRLLRGAGQLMIYVPNGRSLSMHVMKGLSISSWIPFHLQLFTRMSLTQLMEEAGFTEVKIYGYTPVSWLPLSLLQWRHKNLPSLKMSYPTWFDFACYPVGWLAAKLGMAEELVGTSTVPLKKSSVYRSR